jgi:hypothetical protein
MATEVKLEMYAPAGANIVTKQPQRTQKKLVTWWQLFENGAKYRFGPDIEVLRTNETEDELARFVQDLEFTVIRSDAEPLVTRPTIIDVTTKNNLSTWERRRKMRVLFESVRISQSVPALDITSLLLRESVLIKSTISVHALSA